MATEKKPVITEKVEFSYTRGVYSFFTKTCAKLFSVVLAILSSIADPLFNLDMKSAAALVSCLWIVNHNDNKLEGISSISSSVCDNLFCKCRQAISDCICKFCYAYNQQSYQTGLKEHNIINGIILRNILLPVKSFKLLKIVYPYLRIESFGDVANVIQARNYIRIIKAFPRKRCAIWSKNIAIWSAAIEKEGKPDNTTYVHSSSKLNQPDEINLEKYWFVDHIFTVYTKQFAKKNNIVINCGGRKCMECIKRKMNCYFRTSENNNTLYINELKK